MLATGGRGGQVRGRGGVRARVGVRTVERVVDKGFIYLVWWWLGVWFGVFSERTLQGGGGCVG